MRKYLIDAVKELQNGKGAPHLIRDAARNRFPHRHLQTMPAGVPWREHFGHLTLSAT